jgi:hypothetical protein
MQNVIRISPKVTLRLTPCAGTASPSSQKPRSKLKPKSRQALTGITNLVVPRATDKDDASNNIVSSSKTPPRRASYDVRIPGPFLRIRHVQGGCFSDAIAVRDMNGGRGGHIPCLNRFLKAEVAESRAHHIILQVAGVHSHEFAGAKRFTLRDAHECLTRGCLLFVFCYGEIFGTCRSIAYIYGAQDFMDRDLLDVLAHWSSSDRTVHKKHDGSLRL